MRALLEAGRTQAEVAAELGISRPTVCFHARQLGIRARADAARRYDWTLIAVYYDQGHSARECRERFGVSRAGWAAAVRRGAVVARPHLIPEDELFVAGRPRYRQHLKGRLLSAGHKTKCCEACGLTDWRSAPLSLELHHINGDGHDNRLESLQLLCPNCHSQTDTWGARNKKRRR